MDYASGGMFYDPKNSYGARSPNYDQTVLGKYYLNNTAPEAAFTRRLAELGRGGMNATGDRSRALYNRAAAGFGAALGTNQELQWTDYLKNLNIDEMEAQMSPGARGQDTSKMGTGLRWLQRS